MRGGEGVGKVQKMCHVLFECPFIFKNPFLNFKAKLPKIKLPKANIPKVKRTKVKRTEVKLPKVKLP